MYLYKKIKIYAGFLLLSSLSCSDDLEIKELVKQENTSQKTAKQLTFNGLTVRHRYKTPDVYTDTSKKPKNH